MKNGRRRNNSGSSSGLSPGIVGTNTTPGSMSISVMWLSLSLVSMIRIWQQDKLVMIGIRASMWTMNPKIR